MSRRAAPNVVQALLAMLLVACGGGAEPAGSAGGARPPDVVVYLLDTLRADALSFYGNPRETAPYLATLAKEGTVFANAFATSTWTAPSSASVLTGVYPDRHGVVTGFLAQFGEDDSEIDLDALDDMELLSISADVPTLAEHFAAAGYDTYGMASNVNIGPEMEFDRGFFRFERHDMRPAKYLRRRVAEWKAEMAERDRPVFLYLHFNDVHLPYNVRPRYYAEDSTRDETAELRARYESELGYLDGFLGEIHEELGLGDDTLMVVVADHGEEFRDHGNLNHDFTLYNELARVPLVFWGPALRVRPGVVGANVGTIDIVPTLFDLAGLDVPAGVDGESLAAFVTSDDKESGLGRAREELLDRPLVLHRFMNDRHLWGVVRGDWKLIEGPRGGHKLFHLGRDPGEKENLAKVHEEMVEKLLVDLDRHRTRGAEPQSTRTNVEIDRNLLERLKALGYVK